MKQNYETPAIQVVLFETEVETAGASTTIDYPWQKDENGNLFG